MLHSRSFWKSCALLRYALWLPPYLILFALLEKLITANYWATNLPVDQLIPFCEYFAVPYALWYPFLFAVGLFLMFRDPDGFRRYMLFLAVGFFSSELIWFVLPNGQDLRPLAFAHDNVFTHAVAYLYRIDTNTNVFPSAHVVGAIGATWAVLNCGALKRQKALRLLSVVLCFLICAATLLIKQHSVLDVASGAALSAAVGTVVYRRSLVSGVVRSGQKLREFLQNA